MLKRLKRFLRFQRNLLMFEVERFIVRGPFHRLFVIIVGIALISAYAGFVVHSTVGGFRSLDEAIWWAFLRLTDPGYLGDDQGVGRRAVSTILTVLGYVIFLGALVAIMTQWLNETLNRLQSGLTPIAQKGHIVIIGWTPQTPILVKELIYSENRVKRFLSRRGARRRLRIAILAEEAGPDLVHELKEALGNRWDPRQVILRSGTPLRVEHLRRVDVFHAAAVMIPAGESSAGDIDATDARAIKILLAIDHSSHEAAIEEKPRIVTELFDAHKVAIARQAYSGQMEILASDVMISRFIVQTIRHPGLSYIYRELVAYTDGNELYTRDCREFDGRPWAEIRTLFTRAIPIGFSRYTRTGYETTLNPDPQMLIRAEDRMVFIAPDNEATRPGTPRRSKTKPDYRFTLKNGLPHPHDWTPLRRVLILGWNRRTPALLQEFDRVGLEPLDVDILSLTPGHERMEDIQRYGATVAHLSVRHLEGDYTSRADLAAIHPEQYDHIVMLAVDWIQAETESDARTMLGFLVLRETLHEKEARPIVLIELMDPANETLLEHHPHEVLITPVILSRLLTHITLRRELRSIFEVLLGPEGPEVSLTPADRFDVINRPFRFDDLQERLADTGDIPLGLYIRTNETSGPGAHIILNPDRSAEWILKSEDAVITLTKG